jgi:flagellar hook-associated protein 1 FlgK
VDAIVTSINDIVDRIAALNLKVTQVEVTGHNANDFRDERDQLVFELSRMIDINSFEDGDGHVTVMVGNGKPLVEGSSTWDLATAHNGLVQDVYWESSNGALTNITSQISGGELKGWTEARDVVIDDYLTRVDTIASAIRSEVNAQHALGIDLNGAAGLQFFTGTSASNMAVNSAIVADSDLIAAALAGEGLPAGNGNAIAIANLQSAATMTGGSTFNEYHNSLVGKVGADVQTAQFNFDHQTTMVQNLENYRQEVSGVSLDEEMVNLIKYQHAYNAAARLITQADEMLETLINIAR